MKRQANPALSSPGERALAQYERVLREQEDLTVASVRNYLSDVRHFIAWYEQREAGGAAHTLDSGSFHPQVITTPALTRYRTYLQMERRQKPASVNRSLISLKRYFGCARQHHLITYDPSAAVKLVGKEEVAPRQLDDQEEEEVNSMADQRQLDLLRRGVDIWNTWRSQHSTTPIDLSKADLSRARLNGVRLNEVRLNEANLSGANLSEADLRGADLSGANLRGADLSRAKLNEARLSRADLSGADLSRAKLNETRLNEAKLSRADLSGADLRGADLDGANLNEAHFTDTTKL
jgi:hypothetical protein